MSRLSTFVMVTAAVVRAIRERRHEIRTADGTRHQIEIRAPSLQDRLRHRESAVYKLALGAQSVVKIGTQEIWCGYATLPRSYRTRREVDTAVAEWVANWDPETVLVDRPGRHLPGEPTAALPDNSPEADAGGNTAVLPWAYAIRVLNRSSEYWIASGDEGATPRLSYVRGEWYEGSLWLVDTPHAAWVGSIGNSPIVVAIPATLPDAIIVEGRAERIDSLESIDSEVVEKLRDLWMATYEEEFPDPREKTVVRVMPIRVRGWLGAAKERATRWEFEEEL